MAPALTLLIVFVLSLLILRRVRKKYEFALAGRIALAAMLVVTAMAHFVYTKGMVMMMPAFLPFKLELVYLTGVMELAAAIGLLVPKTSTLTGYLLIAFFLLLLPANIYAALNHVDMQKASFDGPGPAYLWFRIPLQLFFIGWTYYAAIKR
jgi:uncharacterized membrane protein